MNFWYYVQFFILTLKSKKLQIYIFLPEICIFVRNVHVSELAYKENGSAISCIMLLCHLVITFTMYSASSVLDENIGIYTVCSPLLDIA